MEATSELWYVSEGKRGQQLLDHGAMAVAIEVFEAVLVRLGEAPSYGRAVILERLGRSFYLAGHPDLAVGRLRDALDVAGKLPPSDGVRGLRGTIRSELGDALRAMGQPGDARKAYEAALKIAEESHDLRAQAVDLSQLGALALEEGKVEEALTRSRAALLLIEPLHEPALEAGARHQLGRMLQEAREWEEAERQFQVAAGISEASHDLAGAARSWSQLAGLLQDRPGRLAHARQLAQNALTAWQSLGTASAQVWKTYGLLADIAEKEAATTDDNGLRSGLEVHARAYRELERRTPQLFATLARLPAGPSCGRAVILSRIGRSFRLAGGLELAASTLREAVDIAGRVAAGGLASMLLIELGDTLIAGGKHREAKDAYEAALAAASKAGELRGEAIARERLALASEPPPAPAGLAQGFRVTVHEELATDYAFDPDLLVDGPRERRITPWMGEPSLLAEDVCPVLMPSSRNWLDDDGAVRFQASWSEPVVELDPGCTILRRSRREVVVSGSTAVLWQLIQRMDGGSTVADMLAAQDSAERETAGRILAALANTGVVDVSGRPVARFLHSATKKGVLPAGGLESDEVLRLATDAAYREYPGAPRVDVNLTVPDRLRTFHALTRSRRSRREYRGHAIRRDELDALLHTACGVTGSMPWGHREVKLRAYPSSGALYAVDIYTVVLGVEGLEQAVYHFRPVDNVLELVRGLDPAGFVGAALPMEREMLAGVAAMFCLVGSFRRHERKYGEGGYRMLVAEAGHISQNLVLAATALGLSARPFGGVFDDLLNHNLGLQNEDEQFLLGVIVGHTGETRSEAR